MKDATFHPLREHGSLEARRAHPPHVFYASNLSCRYLLKQQSNVPTYCASNQYFLAILSRKRCSTSLVRSVV